MTAPAQSLHHWHRTVFTKRHEVTLQIPEHKGTFGAVIPAQTRDVTLHNARTVVCSRTVNGMSPAEWKTAQDAFDASDEGKALDTDDAGVRHEHCELWLLRVLYESDHPDMVPSTEMALNVVLDHHAHSKALHAHRTRLVAGLGAPKVAAPVVVSVPPPAAAPAKAADAKVPS